MKPGKLTFVEGDATEPRGDGVKVIVHCCNDIGAWGAGFVMALEKKWPFCKLNYWHHLKQKGKWDEEPLGTASVGRINEELVFCNLIGQHGVGRDEEGNPPIRYWAIAYGLLDMIEGLADEGYPVGSYSVHMPRMGCGLAGGEWEVIERIIGDALLSIGVDVTVYDWKG